MYMYMYVCYLLQIAVFLNWYSLFSTTRMTESCHVYVYSTGVNPGGMGGDVSPPPHLFGWGMACTNIPLPLFEDKITLNLTFIVKKLTFSTVKLLKLQKSLARSLARTQMYSETQSLWFCQYYSFLDIIYVNKGVE